MSIRDYINPGTPEELKELFERQIELAGTEVRTTRDAVHIYVNSATGSDSNEGTEDEPLQTLQAAFDLIPFQVEHNVVVHLEGTFGRATLEKVVNAYATILIDGGSEVTVVADDSGSPWVADISSSASIGLTTAGWTPDQYEGYLVEILSGPALGQTRMIQTHNATTITPVRNFSIDPGAGAQFRIVRPATTISGGTLACSQIGGYPQGFNPGGTIKVQRLYFDPTTVFDGSSSDGAIILSHVILDNYFAPLPLIGFGGSFRNSGLVVFSGNLTDPTTLVDQTGATASYAGVKGGTISFGLDNNVLIQGSVVKIAAVLSCMSATISNGCKINFMLVSNSGISGVVPLPGFLGGITFAIYSSFGYAATTFGPGLNKFGPAGANPPCIYVYGGGISLQNCDVQGSLSNGIELVNAYLNIDRCVSSTPNANAGVYFHSGSVINVRSKVSAPAITGTALGDLTIDNIASLGPGDTWATIFGGAPYSSAVEMLVAKNYDVAWAEY